jgi:hypothetical protein
MNHADAPDEDGDNVWNDLLLDYKGPTDDGDRYVDDGYQYYIYYDGASKANRGGGKYYPSNFGGV